MNVAFSNFNTKVGKPVTPGLNPQNQGELEDTYYGRFRVIVKQRFFGLKLEEEPFMEFINMFPVRNHFSIFSYLPLGI